MSASTSIPSATIRLNVLLYLFFISYNLQAQWSPDTIDSDYPGAINLVNENVFYLFTHDSVSELDGIIKSTDGGKSWKPLPYFKMPGSSAGGDSLFFQSFHPFNFHFFNEEVGIASGYCIISVKEMIIKTTDGGETWKIVHHENPLGLLQIGLFNLQFVNDQIGYAAGSQGRIVKTTDGGDSWQALPSPTINRINAIQFFSAENGIVAGEKIFMKTSDGGESWDVTKLPFDISGFHFFDPLNGVASSYKGYILYTSDGGQSWTKSFHKFPSGIWRFLFVNNSVGYAFKNSIFKTVDGGKSWFKDIQGNHDLNFFDFLDENIGIATGTEGKLFITYNGGTQTYLPPTISSFTPDTAKLYSEIQIEGNNLGYVTQVFFNGIEAEFTSNTDGTITAIVPLETTDGQITLIYPDGSVSSDKNFIVSREPAIQKLPEFHPRGSDLIIEGAFLQSITRVIFGNISMPFHIKNDKEIVVTVSKDFVETGVARQVKLSNENTTVYGNSVVITGKPIIKENSPGEGLSGDFPLVKGQYNFIHGDNFGSVNSVKLNNQELPFEIIDNQTIKIFIPFDASAGYLTLSALYESTKSNTPYQVIGKPELDSADPLTANPGEWISISGSNFLKEFDGVFKANSTFLRHEWVNDSTYKVQLPMIEDSLGIQLSYYQLDLTSNLLAYSPTANFSAPHIDKIEPASGTQLGRSVKAWGVFPIDGVDSVTLGKGTIPESELIMHPAGHGVGFTVPAEATTGKIKIYLTDTVLETSYDYIVSATPPPNAVSATSYTPAVNSRLQVQGEFFQQIDSILISGEAIDFTILNKEKLYIYLPKEVINGPLQFYTQNGNSTSAFELQLQRAEKGKPQIHAISGNQHKTLYSGDYVKLIGNNFQNLSDLKLNDVSVDSFFVIHPDTLGFRVPYVPVKKSLTWNMQLYAHSPYGITSFAVQYTAGLHQNIQSIDTLDAVQGATLEIVVEEQEPNTPYHTINGFAFNNTTTKDFIKITDTLYRVVVPLTANLSGKIGLTYGGTNYINYFDQPFTLATGYCLPDLLEPEEKPSINITYFRLGDYEVFSDTLCQPYSLYAEQPVMAYSGHTYPLAIQILNCDGINSGNSPIKVYIDFNADNDFEDEGELALSFNKYSKEYALNTLLTIPENAATNQPLRLRIVTGLYQKLEELTPCSRYFSETEDHLLIIKPKDETFAVTDIYPHQGNEGSLVLINGMQTDQTEAVYFGEENAEFTLFSANSILAKIPFNAGATITVRGKNEEATAPENFTYTGGFQSTYEKSPGDNVIINSGSPTLFSMIENRPIPWAESPHHRGKSLYFDYPNNLKPGTLCTYNQSGSYCTEEPVVLPPEIQYFTPEGPFIAGQEVKVYGRYFQDIEEVTLNGVKGPDFEVKANRKITFTIPSEATTGPITVSNQFGTDQSLELIISDNYCEPGTDRIYTHDFLKELTISNYSYYTSQKPDPYIIHEENIKVVPGLTYGLHYTTHKQRFTKHKAYIDWNQDFVFDELSETVSGQSRHFYLPQHLKEGTKLKMRILFFSENDNYESCVTSGYKNAEVHDLTLLVSLPDNLASQQMQILGSKPQACVNEALEFRVINTAEESSYTYFWHFGDGTSSQLPTPEHQFASAGEYEISAELTDENGVTNTLNYRILIHTLPEVSIWFENDTLFATGGEEVRWLRNEENIGITNTYIPQPSPGVYKALVTDINGCIALSEKLDLTILGELNSMAESIIVFPNPASRSIQLKGSHLNSIETVSLYNVHMQRVEQWHAEPEAEKILKLALATHQPGIYILEIKLNPTGRIYKKIIIQR